MLTAWTRRFHDLLHRPLWVLWICVGLGSASVMLDGSFIHLWSLHRNLAGLNRRIDESKRRLRQLEFQIHEAKQPQFIEHQARDQFDLVKEGDLIFVFAEDSMEPERDAMFVKTTY